eukprot:15365387-Ditylum_brightwellii.AAC.1
MEHSQNIGPRLFKEITEELQKMQIGLLSYVLFYLTLEEAVDLQWQWQKHEAGGDTSALCRHMSDRKSCIQADKLKLFGHLPWGITTKQQMNSLPSLEEAVASIIKEHVFHHKNIDDNAANEFKEAVKMKAIRQYDAYYNHVKQHVEEVREGRMEK